MRPFLARCAAAIFAVTAGAGSAAPTAPRLAPDLVVATDGSGDFRSVQAAIDAIPRDNRERKIIFIKPGTYREHLRLETSFVTLLGEDREKTRLVWEINDPRHDPAAHRDGKGIASLTLHNASDVVIDTLTVDNPAQLGGKPFVVFSSGEGTRIVIQNANVTGRGGDSLSLWSRGLYYHRNLYVTGTYHFVGPRGTCYLADSRLEVLGPVSNALFNEGMQDERQRFVLHRCEIVSRVPFGLGSHFRDAAWYFIDCRFPDTLRPDGRIFVAQSNPQRPQPTSAMFKWATDRVYFAQARGPAYPWLRDNLNQSPAKSAAVISAAWTFSGEWDPEDPAPPAVRTVTWLEGQATVTFAEPVTVRGRPRLTFADGRAAWYEGGSGTEVLRFRGGSAAAAVTLDPTGGALIACRASAHVRALVAPLALVP
jgi:pectinesterase